MGSLLKFLSLTYSVTWACFITAAAISHGTASTVAAHAVLRGPLLLLGTFAPSLVALWLTTRAEGSTGAVVLLRRMLEWRVGARWYLFAVSYMAQAWYVIVVAIVISTPVHSGEEIGWRGYALPRLASRFGFARASVLLGLIWACWHLPLFFLRGAEKYGQSFPLWVLEVTALSVAIAYLYANTYGSLLLTMLMHSAVNQTVGIVPSAVANAANPFTLRASPVMWLTAAFLWITAVYFLVRMPETKPRRAREQ